MKIRRHLTKGLEFVLVPTDVRYIVMTSDFYDPVLARIRRAGIAGSVDAAFQRLHATLSSSQRMISVSANHRASIESCLKRNFGLTAMFQSGSYGNGTNIGGYSDVDLFAVIPTDKLKLDSSISLSAIADSLRYTFPQTKGIRIDNPGVKVPFAGGSELVEIIPADKVGITKLGFPMYEIADGAGGWIKTSPKSHNAYVQECNERLSKKVKPLIRFIKAWKYYRNVPIKSFYIEMLVTRYCSQEQFIVYNIDINKILNWLSNNNIPPIDDPRNISGTLYPVGSRTDLLDAQSKVKRAAEWASRAHAKEFSGDILGAFSDWNLVFNDNFPLFGKD